MVVKQQTKQKVLIAVCVSIVVILLILFALSGDNFHILKSLFTKEFSNEELGEQLKGFGWRGYIVIASLSTLQVLCTFLPAEPVQVLGGFTFGFPVGLLCCMIGVLLGNSLVFMLHNLFGDELRGFFVKKLNLNMEQISKSSKVTLIVFILYFLPIIPYGMICFLAASMGMSYRRYILVTWLGALPSVCIGVGLGYMFLASRGVISICVFAALIALAIVMILKRDILFSKVNDYALKHKKLTKVNVRAVNGFVMTVLYWSFRFYLFICGVKIKTINKVSKPEEPAIVLCNHGSFIDFIYAASLLRHYKPHFIVARLYFYNTILGWLLKQVGAFPKSMFVSDLENAKNCLTVLRNNEILAMMPEARLSTIGRFEDIQDTTYSFVKKSGATVYTIKINGDYFADPKWGKGLRRGSIVEVELDILYTAEQVQTLSLDELSQGIEQRLNYNEFEWLQQRPQIHYKSRRMAEGLENILTVCPICNRKHTIITQKDKVLCEHCGYLTTLNDRYGFSKDFCFKNFAEWYDWQMALLKKEILENKDYVLSSKVELRLQGNGNGLTRYGGEGVCALSRDGLTYCGTKDEQEVELHFSIRRIYRLLFGAGENFEIYDGAQILYFVPEERRSAVEWYMTSMILYDESKSCVTTGGSML